LDIADAATVTPIAPGWSRQIVVTFPSWHLGVDCYCPLFVSESSVNGVAMADRADRRRTPTDLEIRTQPRRPVTDPTLGIDVPRGAARAAKHRLVTIGDSLTHGFMSGAVYRTDLSWPAIIAYELGLHGDEFRFPTYEWPTGPGGLPLDLERLARSFEARFGDRLDWWEIVRAGLWARSYMDEIEDYWERGEGSRTPSLGEPFHNMGVYGWDVLDAQVLTAKAVAERIDRPKDDLFAQVVENNGDRAGLTVLQRARSGNRPRTVLDAAAAMARGPGQGIETLVVVLGANNALGSVVRLAPSWTDDGYDAKRPGDRFTAKRGFNVWRPKHFAADWRSLVERLRRIAAQHVIVATVPSVTIAPIARGVAGKVRPDSRFFPYYTRPWIEDDDFDAERDPHLTEDEARAIDSTIDHFNETIIASVEAARRDGLDWYVFELGGLLDSLAVRRYIESPWARPTWWEPYRLPLQLAMLDPVPSTRFFRSGPGGRTDGGFFSLDGVHPTTIGYGIVAQEIIRVMQTAGVPFFDRTGQPRDGTVLVDFDRLIAADTLIRDPPAALTPTLALLGWLDERLDWTKRILPFTPNPL
jgi:hypothetical protein